MIRNAVVQCPYCFEEVDLYVDPQTRGGFVEDCYVCCRPWQVHVERHGEELAVSLSRAQ